MAITINTAAVDTCAEGYAARISGSPELPSATVRAIAAGDTVIWANNGHDQEITGEVVFVDDPPRMPYRIVRFREVSRRPAQLPDPIDGQDYRVPEIGHAHARRWETGEIVSINGRYWKCQKAVAKNSDGTIRTWKLAPATQEQFQTRRGSFRFPDWPEHQIRPGVYQLADGTWLHVEEIKSQVVRSAGISGKIYTGYGRRVVGATKDRLVAKYAKTARIEELRHLLRPGNIDHEQYSPGEWSAQVQAWQVELAKLEQGK